LSLFSIKSLIRQFKETLKDEKGDDGMLFPKIDVNERRSIPLGFQRA